MSFSRSGNPGPGFSYPVGTGVFTDVIISNSLITSNIFFSVSNIAAQQANVGTLQVNVFSGGGNTLSNIQFANVSGFQSNTLSNLNASGLAFGVVNSSLIYGNLISNVNSSNIVGTVGTAQSVTLASQPNITSVGTLTNLTVSGLLVASNGSGISNLNSSNLTQPFANLSVSNTLTTTNVVAAGFTSNASNTVFNYTTLSVPYINCTSLNVTTTATYSTINAVNSLATGSIGFPTIAGTGGVVTQLTSRNTGVTLNKPCGTITLFSSAINSQATNTFTLTNSYIGSTDFVLVNHLQTQTPGAYTIATNPNAGSVDITMRNVSGGTLTAGAPVLQFVVIKSTNA